MIKNHFTAGAYLAQSDPYIWDAIDDVLTYTTLTTLPLWLLGSDQDTQDIVASLSAQGGLRDEFTAELARKYTADRDYETALQYIGSHIAAADGASEPVWKLYLYLLGKTGQTAQAEPIIASLETAGRPGIDSFLDWYKVKFHVANESGDVAAIGR
jgi:hypothetical protein